MTAMEVIQSLFSRSKLCDLQLDMHNKCAYFFKPPSDFLLHENLCNSACMPVVFLKLVWYCFKFVDCCCCMWFLYTNVVYNCKSLMTSNKYYDVTKTVLTVITFS